MFFRAKKDKPELTSAGKLGKFLIFAAFIAVVAFVGHAIYLRFSAGPVIAALGNLQQLHSGSLQYTISLVTTETAAAPTANNELKATVTSRFKQVDDFVQSATVAQYEIPSDTPLPLFGQFKNNPTVEVLSVDPQNIFLKFSGVPPREGLETQLLNNQWIKFNTDELEQFVGAAQPPTVSTAAQNLLGPIFKSYRHHRFLLIEKIGDDTVDGTPAVHYRFTVDTNKFEKFLARLNEVSGREVVGSDVVRRLTTGATISGEVWLTADQALVRRVEVAVTLSEQGQITTMTGAVTLTNYNGPVSVEAPAEALDFKEAFAGAGAVDKISGKTFRDADIIADVNRVRQGLRTYFGSKTQYPQPPVGDNVIGLTGQCLTERGFERDAKACANRDTIVRSFSAHPLSPVVEYRYYLCDSDVYVLKFVLTGDGSTEYEGGTYFAFDNSISPNSTLTAGCIDTDVDGLANFTESNLGTTPDNADSDGDGFADGQEVLNGFDPLAPPR